MSAVSNNSTRPIVTGLVLYSVTGTLKTIVTAFEEFLERSLTQF